MILSLNGFTLVALLVANTSAQPAFVDTVTRRPDAVGASAGAVMSDTARTFTAADSGSDAATAALPSRQAGDTIQHIDTIPRRRTVVEYSDAYGTRAKIHRRLSYTMLPLFALSYYTGDKLFDQGPNASSTVRNLHRISATSVSVLFAVNSVTGGINLWQGRHDPIERKRKLLHSALFLASSAGFTYAGAVLANEAETSLVKRKDHRNLNLVSMGLSVSSVLVMMVGRD